MAAVRAIAMLMFVILPCYCSCYCHSVLLPCGYCSHSYHAIVRAIVILLFVLLLCCCSCFCHGFVLLPCCCSCSCHAIVRAFAMLLFLILPSYCSSVMFNAKFSPRERYCPGPKSKEVRKRGRLYATLYCHHQNDFCIKMDSDENHFNVLFVAKDTVTITIKRNSVSPYTTTLQSQITSSDPERTPAVTRHCPMSFGYF